MTVAEIKEMIKNIDDNAMVQFVGVRYDRDGYANDCSADVNCIVSDKAKMVKDEHGCDTVVDFDQLTTLVKQ